MEDKTELEILNDRILQLESQVQNLQMTTLSTSVDLAELSQETIEALTKKINNMFLEFLKNPDVRNYR